MKTLFCIACLMAISLTASAQEYPKVELFGGYSYFRAGGEKIDLASVGATGSASQDAANLNGFNLSLAGNLNRKIGVVGDIGGHYGTLNYRLTTPVLSAALSVKTSFYTFLFGPQFNLRGTENKNTFFVRPMIGVIHGKQSSSTLGPDTSGTANAFAAAFGGGYQRKLSERVSFRAFQIDYVLSRFDQGLGAHTQSNLRISTGFTFH